MTWRDQSSRRIRGRKGVALRTRVKRRSPLCQDCAVRNRVELATEVHHIVALGDGGTNDAANLVPLCRRCHQRRHGAKPRAQRVDASGWPLPDD
jgi:5-methylcytosine-specific restriction enzyme A